MKPSIKAINESELPDEEFDAYVIVLNAEKPEKVQMVLKRYNT
jgi:hypothetical protein